MLAEMLVGLLEDDGLATAGPARTVAGAMDILRSEPVDVALLDIRLIQEDCYAVAYALRDRGIPFIFVSACRPLEVPRDFRSRPFIEKPFPPRALTQTVQSVLRADESQQFRHVGDRLG